MGLLNHSLGKLIPVSLAAILLVVAEVASVEQYPNVLLYNYFGANGHPCVNNNCHFDDGTWRCWAGKNWIGVYSQQECSPRRGYDHLDQKCNGPCAPREESYYWCWNSYNWAGWNYCSKIEDVEKEAYQGEQ